MSELNGPICKLDRKTVEKLLPLIAASAAQARFICRKCGRAAASKKLLCKPVSMERLSKS